MVKTLGDRLSVGGSPEVLSVSLIIFPAQAAPPCSWAQAQAQLSGALDSLRSVRPGARCPVPCLSSAVGPG